MKLSYLRHITAVAERGSLRAAGLATTVAVANSDLLIMVPEQWLNFPRASENLAVLPITEPLPAPPICIVTRAQMPLTPAAQFLADLFHRASLHYREARGKQAKRTPARR
jgi:LysR family transcriptional regulator of abg operon